MAGKDQRDEERLTDKQRETIAKLYRTHGMDAILERFGGEPWNLGKVGAEAVIAAEKAHRRAKAKGSTDWAKRFREFAG